MPTPRRRTVGVAAAALAVLGSAALSTACLPAAGEPNPAQWAALRACESGGDYGTDTGNGYYGAYQFSLPTWQSLGYLGRPDRAPPAVQDAAALDLWRRSGWAPWPVCGAQAADG